MCGIAGFVNCSSLNYTSDQLVGMLGAIQFRGPDAMGIYLDNHAGLGHVRLSIIDLAGGDQPICNEDKTVFISYNGEIYNYPDLRNELLQKGHTFTTMTDTEVLVHLYEEEGISFLNRLNGQWAFAIWDTRKKRLFIARDRVGVRPVYYTIHNKTFHFSSEIKALFTLPEITRAVDPRALDQIFTFWAPLPGQTFFKGIHELPPGHALLFDGQGVRIEKYWDIPLYTRDAWYTDSPDALSEEVRQLLVDAVKIRLRADVPVGTYLSGGLDSSGIAAIVSQQFNPGVQTFGIRFDEDRFDEGSHQHEMVRFLNVKHRELQTDSLTIADAFCDVVRHCEKPLLRTAPVPLYLLAGLVRESGIIVVLTGEGADEFHGGYDIFKEALVRSFWGKHPDSHLRGQLIHRLYPDIFRNERMRKMTMSFFGKDVASYNDPFFSHQLRWANTSRIKTFFSNSIRSELNTYNPVLELEAWLPKGFGSWHVLHRAQFLEIALFLSNYLLSSQGDRMGMAHSIEVRMPYLDHRLMDFMGRVPPWWKICGLHEKHLLKKALHPFLPPSITARVKHPYRAPIHHSLLAFADSDQGHALLRKETIDKAGLFDADKTSLLLSKLKASTTASETDSMALAGILSTQSIWTSFVDDVSFTNVKSIKPGVVIDNRTL